MTQFNIINNLEDLINKSKNYKMSEKDIEQLLSLKDEYEIEDEGLWRERLEGIKKEAEELSFDMNIIKYFFDLNIGIEIYSMDDLDYVMSGRTPSDIIAYTDQYFNLNQNWFYIDDYGYLKSEYNIEDDFPEIEDFKIFISNTLEIIEKLLK